MLGGWDEDEDEDEDDDDDDEDDDDDDDDDVLDIHATQHAHVHWYSSVYTCE